MVQHRAMLTIADQEKVVYDRTTPFSMTLNHRPPVSRSRYSLTLNISETVWEAQFQWIGTCIRLLNSVISNDLEWSWGT